MVFGSSGLAWVEHLAALLKSLQISPSKLETTVFAGYVTLKDKSKSWVQVVAYVDDLLIFSRCQEATDVVFKHLASALKIKKTGEIKPSFEGGGKIRFLGRNIERKPMQKDIAIKLDNNYLEPTFNAYQISKGTDNPPDLRPLLDDPKEEKEVPLTTEAASKYRAALGKISWMCQTLLRLSIYSSLLATGVATPLVKHENALRAVLRWMFNHRAFVQCFPSPEFSMDPSAQASQITMYTDASWAPLRCLRTRSISEGSVVKDFCRVQSLVALSSCEAELSSIAESVQEAIGLVRLTDHLHIESKIRASTESMCEAVALSQLHAHLFEEASLPPTEREPVALSVRADMWS